MTFPTQKEIELPLLQEIAAMGGEAKPQDLYPKVAAHFPQITEADLKEKVPTGANKWENWVQWARQHLVNKGETDNSVRGIWIITEKGRERLRKEKVAPSPVSTEIAPAPLPPPSEPNKLAKEIKSRLEKLVELAKKKAEMKPLLSHDELVQKSRKWVRCSVKQRRLNGDRFINTIVFGRITSGLIPSW